MHTVRALLRSAALVGGGLVVLGILAGCRPTLDATVFADGEALTLAVAWASAAAVAVWHVLGALACAGYRMRPRFRVLASMARLAPATARRTAGITSTLSVLLAPAVAPAWAADEPVVRAVPTTTTTTAPVLTAPAPAVAPAPPPPPPIPSPPVAPGYVVTPGDSLWRIATAELARARPDVQIDEDDIVPYWLRVIDANRATLRSGDPSLIYPGEVVTLPPPVG